jgi:hypothetical protein
MILYVVLSRETEKRKETITCCVPSVIPSSRFSRWLLLVNTKTNRKILNDKRNLYEYFDSRSDRLFLSHNDEWEIPKSEAMIIKRLNETLRNISDQSANRMLKKKAG